MTGNLRWEAINNSLSPTHYSNVFLYNRISTTPVQLLHLFCFPEASRGFADTEIQAT